MTINQKKSLVAFYISKFNDDAFRELGYSGPVSKAMDDLSVRITGPGVEPNAYLRLCDVLQCKCECQRWNSVCKIFRFCRLCA